MRRGDAVRARQAVSGPDGGPQTGTNARLSGPGPARAQQAGGRSAAVRSWWQGPPRLGIGPVILVEHPVVVIVLSGLTRSGHLVSRWRGSARRWRACDLAGWPARPTR